MMKRKDRTPLLATDQDDEHDHHHHQQYNNNNNGNNSHNNGNSNGNHVRTASPMIVRLRRAVMPCYRQRWCWTLMLLLLMAVALVTTNSSLANLLENYSTTNMMTTTTSETPKNKKRSNKNTNKKGVQSSAIKKKNIDQHSSTSSSSSSSSSESISALPPIKDLLEPLEEPDNTELPPNFKQLMQRRDDKLATKQQRQQKPDATETTESDTDTSPEITTTTTTTTTTDSEPQDDTDATTTTTSTTSLSSSSPANFPFRHRGPQLDEQTKAALALKWGTWSLPPDPKATTRPVFPCAVFSHCDVPRDQFPSNAWQGDVEFLKSFLTQGHDLVLRAQEAILAEYGQSKFDKPNKTLAERSLNFQLDILQLDGDKVHPPDSKKRAIDNGGWTTHRSFKGLVRRLLHAIMTQDTFTFVLGGHSVAAGHGNYFKQSYSMQFHKAMEPIFGRLGVQLHSHNFGKGGLGTAQDTLGMATLWGSEIDFCMWDCGMTEFSSSHYDLFARQALIGGNRVPILWNGFPEVLETLHNQADVDIGGPGTGLKGTPYSQSKQQAEQLPYAVRFLRCTQSRSDLCDNNRYNTRCWLDRPDVKPPRKQNWEGGGRMLQHPGFRSHQLSGRVLAFTVLLGLEEALKQWKNAPNYELPDEAWHVTPYYQNIRTKLAKLTSTPCFNDTNMPSPRICTTPMKGVSEYTPRARPDQTSIRSIITDKTYIPDAPVSLYTGPDVYNPALEPPEGEVNYLAIVENEDAPPPTRPEQRRQLTASVNEPKKISLTSSKLVKTNEDSHRKLSDTKFTPGRGWSLHLTRNDIPCNGTYDSECGRNPENQCLLYGHNDGKYGLVFDSLSGWLLMRLKGVKEGLIVLKLETWQHKNHLGKWSPVESSEATEGWTEVNNGMDSERRRQLRETLMDATQTKLDSSTVAPELCDDFAFDYAINGQIQTLSKEEFLQKRIFVQKVVETWTLLDDPNFTSGQEKDVDLAIRMRGCQRRNSFKLTHLYWS